MALQLKGGSEAVILHTEYLRADVNASGFLQTSEPVLVSKARHIFLDSCLKLRVLAKGCEVAFDSISCRPLARPRFLGNNDCDDAVFERVSVDEALANTTCQCEDVFDLLRGDILSL